MHEPGRWANALEEWPLRRPPGATCPTCRLLPQRPPHHTEHLSDPTHLPHLPPSGPPQPHLPHPPCPTAAPPPPTPVRLSRVIVRYPSAAARPPTAWKEKGLLHASSICSSGRPHYAHVDQFDGARAARRRRRTAAATLDAAGPGHREDRCAEEGSRRRRRVAARVHPADGGPAVQLRRARIPGSRDAAASDRRAGARRLRRPGRSPAFRRAWVASWGSGKPVIALGSDIDGIPQRAQKPGVVTRKMVAGAPGHGEGHNAGHAAQHHRRAGGQEGHGARQLPGTLMLWPGVAEELLGTKAYFVRAGMFKDVDVVLFTHVGNDLGTAGATATAAAWCRSSTSSRARARTPPAHRGAAAARSTPSS